MWAACWSTCAILPLPTSMLAVAAPVNPLHTFAEVELDGIRIGIPAGCVAQVVARPPALAALPRSHGACEGVFQLGRQVVPLVDLRRWMSPPGSSAIAPLVVVLRCERRVIGLAIDAIYGVRQVAASAITLVHRDDAADSFFESVATVDAEQRLISLLEPLRLIAQVQAWTDQCEQVAQPLAGPDDAAPDEAPRGGAATALQATFSLGGQVFSLAAADVAEVLPWPQLQHPFGSTSQLNGMLLWRGHNVALLKASVLLGRETASTTSAHVLLLKQDDRVLALPVDQVLSVRTFAASALDSAADLGMARADLFCGIAQAGDASATLLLNTKHLLDCYALAGLASNLGTRQAGQERLLNDEAYIVFDTGVQWALPMSTMEQIIALPSSFEEHAGRALGVCGSVAWNGRTLPVLDLRVANGGAARGAGPRLIVVQWQSRLAGLLVQDVIELIPVHGGTLSRFNMLGQDAAQIITVDQPPGARSVRVMALTALPFFASCSPGP
jgi:chemotaxis signal transduction protein